MYLNLPVEIDQRWQEKRVKILVERGLQLSRDVTTPKKSSVF